jgi:hypothetical protein
MGASSSRWGAAGLHDPRGQTTPFVLLALALVVVAALAVGHTGVVLVARAQAAHAADAAALAGALEGRAGAAAAAEANGATLVEFHAAHDVVTVTVRRGNVSATAAAQFVLELSGG